ncbi:hypothetical protein SCYAM73S_01559 [Streptomyces cyaneofuscatus]
MRPLFVGHFPALLGSSRPPSRAFIVFIVRQVSGPAYPMVGVIPWAFWNFWIALQSAADCLPSTGRFRNFSTCFWYGPVEVGGRLGRGAGTQAQGGCCHQTGHGERDPASQSPSGYVSITPMCPNSPSPTVVLWLRLVDARRGGVVARGRSRLRRVPA